MRVLDSMTPQEIEAAMRWRDRARQEVAEGRHCGTAVVCLECGRPQVGSASRMSPDRRHPLTGRATCECAPHNLSRYEALEIHGLLPLYLDFTSGSSDAGKARAD